MFSLLNCLLMVSHVSGSSSFPKPLSVEDERIHLEKYAGGSLESKNILIEHNLRLVAHIAKKYNNYNRDNEDLISVGTIGLIKAIATFKPQKGTRLATYAARCIDNAM